MQVHDNLENLPSFHDVVLTIGTFDGVHKGHQQIIQAVLEEADRIKGESVIITFHPHPRKIVDPHASLQLINTLAEKTALLQKTGIDHLVVVPFSASFSALTAESYIEDFLVKNFHPRSIIIGYDHHFGKGRKGNFKLLNEVKEKWNFNLIEIPKHVLDEIDISSTKIRKALLHAEIEKANKLLGYNFFFEGKVVKGDQLGRQLGFPTANLIYTDSDKIHLGEGVYAVTVQMDKEEKKGMLSIGKRPTLNDVQERIEVNIFDFDSNIYHQHISVTVHAFIRSQYKFDSLDRLKEQIIKDKAEAIRILDQS